MKPGSLLLLLAGLLLVTPAAAQVRPEPGPGDPRIQSVLYDPNQVVQLQAAAGYQVTVEFAPDERIENVAVGDSGAWQITPNKRGDRLFVKAVGQGVTSNLTVVTDARTYIFELSPLFGPLPTMAYVLRFRYATPAAVTVVANDAAVPTPGRYKLNGDKALRPSAIDDDGVHTYLAWAPDQTLPAIFAIDSEGRESLVNGMVRDGRFVIDAVANHLVFRIDRRTAGATRVPQKRR
ncbi:TrbG/VirB9 family P-type conjugative transfer protein [Sphingomonas sp. AR_OL41]|uniref:TrbG/VirB9 family P-type conjugative transfer protein n=1 Tax=Sphingomonas sp. AR_OL41 TaxID=3042729 RepID=UPI002481052A|nr:TrbG/VirB9 family P-type conjugative transfer protein [Sphingomonas sp. AR_OL41]MDH7973006.1 TrbG/VirB9 family P-type conjugative transfer protein [Sphingomonas sp. AR_OL41]